MPRRRERRPGLDFVDALPADGERRLLLAVLLDAIQCLSNEPADSDIAYPSWVRDLSWFLADDRGSLCSFVTVCEVLGLNPNYVRRRVMERSEQPARPRIRRYGESSETSWGRQRAKYAASAA